MDEGAGAIVLALIASLFILIPLYETEKEKDENLLKNCEVIETYINTTRNGYNNYILILENESGELIEIDTDVNTFVKYGGDLKND